MPKATTNIAETERFELKSCPEGYVVLRRLTYGEFLERRDMAAKIGIKSDQQNRRASQSIEGTMVMMQEKVTEYEFARCILEHNLEDEDGRKLDFKNLSDIKRLDPRVGEEISSYCDKMNQFEDDLGN